MLVQIQVPLSIYKRVKSGEDVKAITNYNDTEKQRAYEILADLSGFDNFWFSMVADDIDKDELKYHCKMSSNEEPVTLLLNIPEADVFITNFYDFSDLIYYTGIEPNKREEKELIKRLKSKQYSGMKQAIFPVLRKSYLYKKLK